ncbi:hypothetical protein SAMN04488598_1854 [Halanaerobium congolense]|uniref:Uncharacterized protein n=1 Tax=Halanaerobium congolense TaxID=54121 RepID=A0A1I0DCV4_9FIRM|nr:hypothetical protein [Halanaerobium congolense]PTX14565.1 hypothetical protein C7953_2988 [Halanaerobium congolense]SDG29163.1 hypothetical protein SAMN04488598_1854 [Halanaerobium congolense]SET30163.1 hypothetical protein SAMN04515652_1792 [Halanaerobium congolense]
MVSKTYEKITDELESNSEYRNLEDKILDLADQEVSEEMVSVISDLREEIIESAYLEGFAAGIEKKTREEFKENITSYLKTTDLNEILDSFEFNKNKNASSN